MNNIIAYYFCDRFNLNLTISRIIAASFGMVNLFSRPKGGGMSDIMAKKSGMRGRLELVKCADSKWCIVYIFGIDQHLGASRAVMIIFSVFVQDAEGLTFGVVPFVSRKSLGVVSGMTGAGGNVGALITQVIFRGSQFTTEKGITYMGIMITACSLVITSICFPQWGGLFCGPKANFTEEEYCLREWDSKEQELGLHEGSMKFAEGSRNERSIKAKSVPTEESNTPDHA